MSNTTTSTTKSSDDTSSFWTQQQQHSEGDNTNKSTTGGSQVPVQVFSSVRLSEREKRETSLKILRTLLENAALGPYLCELLSHKNSDGATPFMYAVSIRAYEAACVLYEAITSTTASFLGDSSSIMTINNMVMPSAYMRDVHLTSMLFPLNSRVDQSPLYALCSNDTCSFTWTGDQHITQDIFECRTCTLVGNLCCCTECARTCHKGHDCKIKTSSSPTAYCDCWEKCKCKSLIAGDQQARLRLFDLLVANTNLLGLSTVRSEHLIIYLVQILARQVQEQKNFKRLSGKSLKF